MIVMNGVHATPVDVGRREARWVVLADRSGIEFCVMPNVVPPEPEPFH